MEKYISQTHKKICKQPLRKKRKELLKTNLNIKKK